jgi:hypothetical protein
MKKFLQRYPLFLLLLPVFFVFHGYVENCFFIRFRDCWSLLGTYVVGALILLALTWSLLKKDLTKAAILTSFIMAFYFFFGAIHDFFKTNHIFLHKYGILLPGFVALSIILSIYLRKCSSFRRIVLFLNVLLLLYLAVDAGTLSWKMTNRREFVPDDSAFPPITLTRCDSCPKPDIYFIVFDCYSGNKTLSDEYHYDNSALYSFLEKEGFHIQKSSFSNYIRTPFSMASILNMNYVPVTGPVSNNEYALGAIERNRVVNYLYSQGYSILNYSPFDIPGHPTPSGQPFMPAKTRLITNRTLLNYIVRDLQPWIVTHFHDSAFVATNNLLSIDHLNQQLLALAMEASKKRSDLPRFIYAHLFMPHFPFLYDSLMRRRPLSDVMNADEDSLSYYLQYLPYTNAHLKELISTIKKNTGGKAVIIFMSDHGLRYMGKDKKVYRSLYNNQNAVYYPDGDYRLLYDSISAVNQFRVVFNKLFRQDLPLLKDSVLFLPEKQ